MKEKAVITVHKFSADEWRLKRHRQKSMNLIGVDDKTRQILSAGDQKGRNVEKSLPDVVGVASSKMSIVRSEEILDRLGTDDGNDQNASGKYFHFLLHVRKD